MQHIKGVVGLWLCRHVGLPRPRPDAEEVPVHHDEERGGERRSEEEMEVAADPAEQGGGRTVFTFKWHPDMTAGKMEMRCVEQPWNCYENAQLKKIDSSASQKHFLHPCKTVLRSNSEKCHMTWTRRSVSFINVHQIQPTSPLAAAIEELRAEVSQRRSFNTEEKFTQRCVMENTKSRATLETETKHQHPPACFLK